MKTFQVAKSQWHFAALWLQEGVSSQLKATESTAEWPHKATWGNLCVHGLKPCLHFNICSALSVHFTATAGN